VGPRCRALGPAGRRGASATMLRARRASRARARACPGSAAAAALLGVAVVLLHAATAARPSGADAEPREPAPAQCTCGSGGLDAVGAEAGPREAVLCARSASRRAVAARPPNAPRAAACARAGRALDAADGWWDFVEGNALEVAGERNKAAALYIRALQRRGGDSWRARFALANMLATSGYVSWVAGRGARGAGRARACAHAAACGWGGKHDACVRAACPAPLTRAAGAAAFARNTPASRYAAEALQHYAAAVWQQPGSALTFLNAGNTLLLVGSSRRRGRRGAWTGACCMPRAPAPRARAPVRAVRSVHDHVALISCA